MNTFGDAKQRFALIDPRSVRDDRRRFRREAIPLLNRVNHFYCPAGRWPFVGYVLLPRRELALLYSYSTVLQLEIGNGVGSDNVGVLQNLCIVQARCVTRGLASDPNALYLIELTDARGILCNRWFAAPEVSFFNCRAPAYPGQFYTPSGDIEGASGYTWSTMLADIWGRMTLLGVWPGLPSTPTGTPEGWWFPGVDAWTALCDALDHIGMSVAADLTESAPYTVVNDGAADTDFDALTTRYANRLEDDYEWLDVGAGRVPGTVKVLFRRRNEYYGSEETVTKDTTQWLSYPSYAITVSAPATFTGAVGVHYLWSDFTIRFDMDGSPLAADVTTATAIANERVTQYFRDIYHATLGYLNRTYTGALPFKTGSRVSGVYWYMNEDGGWRTQVVRGAEPPWPGVWE